MCHLKLNIGNIPALCLGLRILHHLPTTINPKDFATGKHFGYLYTPVAGATANIKDAVKRRWIKRWREQISNRQTDHAALFDQPGEFHFTFLIIAQKIGFFFHEEYTPA